MKIIASKTTVTVTNHESVNAYVSGMRNPNTISIVEVVERIVTLNDGIRQFWSNAQGWAPLEAAQLLNKSRLDWQVSLSECLRLWISPSSALDTPGTLILAWANLGSLVEGSLKLFLSVNYETYKADVEAIKRKGKLQDPDGLQLEPLRQFFKKRIWDDSLDATVQLIQQRRNAIHAFQNRDIGTHDELAGAIRAYLSLLRYINARLPYPDEMYVPQEIRPHLLHEF